MREAVAALRAEATATNERRLLVVTGTEARTREAASDALDAAGIELAEVTQVGPDDALPCEQLSYSQSTDLLGRTREAVVVDCHTACRPNVLGRAVGAVDGGGLLVLRTPPLSAWPARRDEFDEWLAVPPATVADVAGNFRTRLVKLLRVHPGIAIFDADNRELVRDGLTHPAPRWETDPDEVSVPADHRFPPGGYEACLTDDQRDAVQALERLQSEGQAVVVEADRGRGKSSAAGLAAGALALAGQDVLVTAPQYRNAAEVFARARDQLLAHGIDVPDESDPTALHTETGRIRFRRATEATDLPGDPDVVIVDEAAALPVRVLEAFLAAPAVAFTTTIHGYEGAGRGFSVRFRDRLAAGEHDVTESTLTDPIRYSGGDPVEVWAFRALLLDARPPVEQVVAEATPETAEYTTLTPTELLADEHLLREVFGLLVLAHYRTEPDDLARLLDAPNVTVRALTVQGHVVSVALLAREGNLPAETRAAMYDGERVRGNVLPDLLTTQLRDESAGTPVGMRVLRIATHHAVRSRGFGSTLLTAIREEFADDVDWLGVGYGATPDLVRFWAANGYRPVHLSMTRNETSGEHSVLMLDPTSQAGQELAARHTDQFLARIGGVLADPLSTADPDIVRAVLSAADRSVDPGLADWEWRHVASAAFGPGLFDMAPDVYRRLGVAYFGSASTVLTDRQERLLVLKALQGRLWDAVATELDFESNRQCMRAFGDALEPLVETVGPPVARDEADRYRD